jgi:hypothetical protein
VLSIYFATLTFRYFPRYFGLINLWFIFFPRCKISCFMYVQSSCLNYLHKVETNKVVHLRHVWEEVYLLLILDLGTKWGWVVSVTPWPRFTPWEKISCAHWIGDGWASELFWKQRLEEKSFASAGDRIPVFHFVVGYSTDWATPNRTYLYTNLYQISGSLVMQCFGKHRYR